MIYQENSNFKVFQFRAEWQIGEETQWQFINEIDTFEKELLEREKHNNFENTNKTEVEEILLNVTYFYVSLTEEQQERFDSIKDLKNITLDQVREYVIDNIEPDIAEYKLINIQFENAMMAYDLMVKDDKIQFLEDKALTLENSQAELIYQLMIGGTM